MRRPAAQRSCREIARGNDALNYLRITLTNQPAKTLLVTEQLGEALAVQSLEVVRGDPPRR